SKRDWKPLEDRCCTDIPWLIIFTLFCIGMACICGYPIATGAATRLVSGYDSYGNTCGQNNTKIEGVTLSGRDMRQNNKSISVFNRCVPTDVACFAEFAQDLVTFISDNNVFRRVIAGVMASKEIIMGLCLLALVLSLIMMVVIRYISKVLVWILTILVIVGSIGNLQINNCI
ncbi:unnamed protein product, partial [Tetraodon nigroviridis]